MSASVVLAPKLTRIVASASSLATPIAARTWLDFIDPDEQALPALIEIPARSNWTSWLAALTPALVREAAERWLDPRALIAAMTNMQGQVAAGVSTIGQAAAAAALDGPQDAVPVMAAAYRRRRDLVVDALNTAPGILCHRPEGAFYVCPNIAGCLGKTTPGGAVLHTDQDFALALLGEQHVALVHGAAFGMSPYVRISYATDDASLTEACRRIVAFCTSLR